MNLVLIGIRGAGKSTVGSLAAQRLGLAFVDIDQLVEQRTGQSVAEIFVNQGEANFRRLESEALASLRDVDRTCIATGGGVVLVEANRRLLGQLGAVFWLQVGAEQALRRTVDKQQRPPLTELSPLSETRAIAAERHELYSQLATGVIHTDQRSAQEVCDELEQLWYTFTSNDLR